MESVIADSSIRVALVRNVVQKLEETIATADTILTHYLHSFFSSIVLRASIKRATYSIYMRMKTQPL